MRRIDPFRRKDINLTSPGDENIENLSDGDKIDVNHIYTSWSRWSRCSRKCKQKRERRCAVPQVQALTNYVISVSEDVENAFILDLWICRCAHGAGLSL